MEPSPTLAALEERLAETARAWDEDGYAQTAQEIGERIDAAADPDTALLEFDKLVEARVDRLAEAGDPEFADLYAATVQDLYEESGLLVFAAYLALQRGELMIVAGDAAAAEPVLREVYGWLNEYDDPMRGASACLLGRAVALQGRLDDAIPLLAEAAKLAQQEQEPGGVAEATTLLGHVLHESGQHADAALRFGRAAELWHELGDEEEAAECLKAAAAAEIGLATDAAERERYAEVESHARRALDLAEGHDVALAAAAAVVLGGARLRLGSPREAQELIEPILPVLRSLNEPSAPAAVAVALLVLGEALGWLSDVVGADTCFREAVEHARTAGDDGLAEFALLQVAAMSDKRTDLGQQAGLLQRLGGGAADPRLKLLAERNAGLRAMREGEFAAGRRHLEEAFRQGQELPEVIGDGMSLSAMRMLFLLADGQIDEAERCLAAVDDAFLAAQRRGDVELLAAVPPYLEMWHGVMSIGRGDHDDADLRLSRARELFLEAGATLNAAVVGALHGILIQQCGSASDAVGHLVPAVLALRSELITLPSSAERAAFRDTYHKMADIAIRAVAATGDHRLVAELLEELQAQSIPRPPADGDKSLSLNSLVFDLAGSAAPMPARTGEWVRADAEQETLLAGSARIRMPWGSIALEPYHEEADRYGAHVVGETMVQLAILR